MDDLHHHLAGRHRLDDGGADSLLAHLLGEGTHHFERDVGLQQRAAHLAHRGIDIGLGQRAAARQPIENATKLFRQIVEHGPINLSSPRPGGERGRIAPPASLRSRRQLSSAIRVRGHPDREVETPHPDPLPMGEGALRACRYLVTQSHSKTRLRPRAHRAVGRWPPASQDRAAGRKEQSFRESRRIYRGIAPKVKKTAQQIAEDTAASRETSRPSRFRMASPPYPIEFPSRWAKPAAAS